MLEALLVALISTIVAVLNLYTWIVIISALITWINPDPYNPIVRFLYTMTEPVYAKIRRYIPTQIGMFDLAPIILLFGLQFIQIFLTALLR